MTKNTLLLSIIGLFSFFFSFRSQAQNVKWSIELDSAIIFSSPRFTDLNNDGTKDVIIGAGNEGHRISNGIVSIDGETGEIIWKVQTETQIYTSALLQDINNDGVQDVFIGGRNVSLYAINGKTGEVIWEFWPKSKGYWKESSYYNFYSTQWLDDQNKDGFKDLLVANGGDATIKPNDKNRPQGKLMIVSGKDGKVINEAKIPHIRETYYAPHIHYNYGDKNPAIIFASGGENIDGNLWEVPLKSLMKNDISKSKILLHDTLKGFIVNSVLADLNNDSKLDIINARINGNISAVNGISHEILWEHNFPNHECYVAPTVGQFTGDNTPDIFTFIAEGTFPGYTNFYQIMIDGATGEIIHKKSDGTYQFASGLAVDYNNDGTDEILFSKNTVDMKTYATTNQIQIIDFKNDTTYNVGNVRNGACFSSTPGIVDLDGNGKKEIVFVYSNSFSEDREYGKVECIELNIEDPNPSFPGYLGTFENGIYLKK